MGHTRVFFVHTLIRRLFSIRPGRTSRNRRCGRGSAA